MVSSALASRCTFSTFDSYSCVPLFLVLFCFSVLDPFHEHFKDGGVTPTLSLFKPLTLLLNLCTDEEEFGWRSDVSSIVKWAASEDGGAIPEFIDSALENFGLSPTTIVA